MNIWIRSETKKDERRAPLTPSHVRILLDQGVKVYVERSDQRIYSDEQYQKIGCELQNAGDWVSAKNCYIVGLKELPEANMPISQQHIYYAHAFKEQVGTRTLLQRFKKGGGTILDYEYLIDCLNQPVVTSSFSFSAGFCGAALSLLIWGAKINKTTFKGPLYYANRSLLEESLQKLISTLSALPRILIIGAYGQSGKGVQALLNQYKIKAECWDRYHTEARVDFSEILEFDMVFNCINLSGEIKPFVTFELLSQNKNLSIIADISCDVSNPNNPLPIYPAVTSFAAPTYRIPCLSPTPVDIIAIDHLASFLPRESSDLFSAQLLPFLLQLLACGANLKNSVWKHALQKYHNTLEKLAE